MSTNKTETVKFNNIRKLYKTKLSMFWQPEKYIDGNHYYFIDKIDIIWLKITIYIIFSNLNITNKSKYSCLENPVNNMKRQKDRTLKEELPRLAGAQYATGEEWRDSSRKNEEAESKQKWHPAVDVSGVENNSSVAKNIIALHRNLEC